MATTPRIGRILAATREQALNGGVRGITIAEIARLAGVGKGTLYLYWTMKEDLLADLFARDFLEVLSEVETAVSAEPGLITPRLLLPLVGNTLSEHPIAAAVHSSEQSLFGTIVAHPSIERVVRAIGPVAMLRRIFPALRRHGVIRSDLSIDTQVHTTAALLHGLHDIDNREPVMDLPPGSDPKVVLARACAALLEPADTVDLRPAACLLDATADAIRTSRGDGAPAPRAQHSPLAT